MVEESMTTKTMKFKEGEQLKFISGDTYLVVLVKVLDSRVCYGREQYSITPVSGSGQRWVDVGSLIHGDLA